MRIKTSYYRGHTLLKTNTADCANRAILHAVNHLQMNKYEATHAEVFDEGSGVLHGVLKRNIHGNIAIVYQRNVEVSYDLA